VWFPRTKLGRLSGAGNTVGIRRPIVGQIKGKQTKPGGRCSWRPDNWWVKQRGITGRPGGGGPKRKKAKKPLWSAKNSWGQNGEREKKEDNTSHKTKAKPPRSWVPHKTTSDEGKKDSNRGPGQADPSGGKQGWGTAEKSNKHVLGNRFNKVVNKKI